MVLGLTPMQKRFIRIHAQTGDHEFAAWKAGYANPIGSGNALMKNPEIVESSRALTQKFLFEKAGKLAVDKLVKLAGDENPSGIQFKAAQELAKLANIAISDQAAEKPASELTAGELGAMVEEMRGELERQRSIAARALATLPRAIIEHDSIFD